jgi:hypothetical protein
VQEVCSTRKCGGANSPTHPPFPTHPFPPTHTVQVYGIRKCDRAEEAGGLRLSQPLCKIKGDMLHMYLALDAEAVAGLERDPWAKVVRDAQSVCDLSAAFVEFATRVRPDWVEAWFLALPQSADWLLPEEQAAEVAGCATTDAHSRPADAVEGGAAGGGKEDSPARMRGRAACKFVGKWSMAQLALQLYGLDEALLYQVPCAVSTCTRSLPLSCGLHHAGMRPQASCALLLRALAAGSSDSHEGAISCFRMPYHSGCRTALQARDDGRLAFVFFDVTKTERAAGVLLAPWAGGAGEGGRLWHPAVLRTKVAD